MDDKKTDNFINQVIGVLPKTARKGARVGKALAEFAGLGPGGTAIAAALGVGQW